MRSCDNCEKNRSISDKTDVYTVGTDSVGAVDINRIKSIAKGVITKIEHDGERLRVCMTEGDLILAYKDFIADECKNCIYRDRFDGPEAPSGE